jgi:hypothetical protein
MTGLLGMTDLGVEMDYDNFTLDFPASIGSGMKHTFRFGVDLVKFKRTWNRDNGTTYEVKIADTQCIPGNAEIFALGDMADVEDSFFGDTVTGERIITYITCLDDPTQNSIILGVFILDSATQTATMQIAINNTVQQGDQYSNVSMDHLNGFMAVLNDGTYTTLNGEGLLHHDGATSAEYHYLTYEADITFTNILSPDFYAHNRVQLPDSFKNKNFTISLSIKSADASFVPSTKGVIQSVGAASFNPDFVNAIVDIGGMFIAYDVTGNAFYTGTSHLIVSLTAIA